MASVLPLGRSYRIRRRGGEGTFKEQILHKDSYFPVFRVPAFSIEVCDHLEDGEGERPDERH